MMEAQKKLDGRRWTESPLPEILRELNQHQATGVLTVGSRRIDREFIFVRGELRAARSSAESEKLGSWLVHHSLISPNKKEQLLQAQEGSDAPPLGHILVAEKLLHQNTLERALEGLALALLERATNEKDAEFFFTEGPDPAQLDTLPGITTPQLMMLSARKLDALEPKRKRIGGDEQHLCLEAPLEEIVHDFDLATDEATLLGKLYISRSIGDLRKSARMDIERFLSACYPLVISGLVTIVPRPKRAVRSNVAKGGAQLEPDASSVDHTVTEEDVQELRRLHSRLKELNHYEFFGISAYASYQDIFDVWGKYDRLYNPTRSSDPQLAPYSRELKEIHERATEAYETLSSPTTRPRYDRMLRAQDLRVEKKEDVPKSVSAREALIQRNLREVESLIRREDFFSAIQLMEKTADLEPSPANLFKLAQLLLLNPRWTARAMEKLKRALEADPKLVEGWLLLADHWRNRKSPERERKALERALVADCNHVKALERYEKLVGVEAQGRFLQRLRSVKN